MVGAIYSTFDGLNLIRTSLESISKAVDFVVIVHQNKDFFGNQDEDNTRQIFKDLYKDKLINAVVYIDDEAMKSSKESVMTYKRNIGIEECKKVGCEYALIMDADECYDCDEIKNTIADMKLNNIHTAYSPIVTFYKDSYHFYNDVYYVPSIYKVDERQFNFYHTSLICDPLRRMPEKNWKLYSNLKMFHLSYVSNLRKKYRSSLARGTEKMNSNMNAVCDYFDSWKDGEYALVFDTNGDLIRRALLTTDKILWSGK